MRTLTGMVLRISEIITDAKASTAMTLMPITIAGSSLAVTARAEQMPSTCTITGLSLDSGLKNTAEFFTFSAMVYLLLPAFFTSLSLTFFRKSAYGRRQSLSIALTPLLVMVPPDMPST